MTIVVSWCTAADEARYADCQRGRLTFIAYIDPTLTRVPMWHTGPDHGPAGARVDRAALAGIMYVLRTGVAWRDVPAETVGCSGVTAWRRLRDWTEAGVWPRLHCALLTELCRADSLDLDDCSMDGSHVRALKGGITSAPRPSTAPAPAPSTT